MAEIELETQLEKDKIAQKLEEVFPEEEKGCCQEWSTKLATTCFGPAFASLGNVFGATEKIFDTILTDVVKTVVTTADWVNAGLMHSAAVTTILFVGSDGVGAEWTYSVITMALLISSALLPYRIEHKQDLANEIELAVSEHAVDAHGVLPVPKSEEEAEKDAGSAIGTQLKILRAQQLKIIYETLSVLAVLSHRRAAQATFFQLRAATARLGGVFLYMLLVWVLGLIFISKQASRFEATLNDTAAALDEKGWEALSTEMTRYSQQKRLTIVFKLTFALGMGWALRDFMNAFNNAVWYTDGIPYVSARASELITIWVFAASGTFFVAGARLVHERYYFLYPATDRVSLFPLGSERRKLAGAVLFGSINYWQQLLWYGCIIESVGRLNPEHPITSAWCLAFALVIGGILVRAIMSWIVEHVKLLRKAKLSKKKQMERTLSFSSDSLVAAVSFMSDPDEIDDDEVYYTCCEAYWMHFFPAIADALTVSGSLHVFVAVNVTINRNLAKVSVLKPRSNQVKPSGATVGILWGVCVGMLIFSTFVVTYLASLLTAAIGARRALTSRIVNTVSGRPSDTKNLIANDVEVGFETMRDKDGGDAGGDGGGDGGGFSL